MRITWIISPDVSDKRKEKQIMEVLAEKKPIEEQVDCNIDINCSHSDN